MTYFPTMDNGFDYPNDLCVQNALWRRLDAIEILQIRLDYIVLPQVANQSGIALAECVR